MQISDLKKGILNTALVAASFIGFPSFESALHAVPLTTPLIPESGVVVASTTSKLATITEPKEVIPAPDVVQQKQQAPVTTAPVVLSHGDGTPVRLSIPSLGMQNPVIGVGTTKEGDMDVPSGTTNNVGWYKYGTKPGSIGSAVFDAHVFAAFANIHKLQPGDRIYVTDDNGTVLTFKVEEVATYKLADVPAKKLFNRKDAPRLNLITCAGKLTPDRSTYDHRFIAYAVLVQ